MNKSGVNHHLTSENAYISNEYQLIDSGPHGTPHLIDVKVYQSYHNIPVIGSQMACNAQSPNKSDDHKQWGDGLQDEKMLAARILQQAGPPE
ncbi:hypothetical protein GX50_03914 [[Emmonsia] crescens]|uniref:Uncharacterized protein n=1 Tax=[Emmonsia] crescens TaxID=73230 RepID=A0A2B7ZGX7_9EURO|nr:hypothetical protein GX50_03914 [Emmonsia crescens]